MALGWFITGSMVWEYDGKWVQLRTYIPVRHWLLQRLVNSCFDHLWLF